MEVRTGKEAISLDADKKQVTVKDLFTGEEEVCMTMVLAVEHLPVELLIQVWHNRVYLKCVPG